MLPLKTLQLRAKRGTYNEPMRKNLTLKIGEFAKLGQVSVATLRYYDDCGLLKPDTLDADTGYRFYTFAQLPRLHRILALKELGFPLEQIAQLLEKNIPLEQLRQMFALKQAQTQEIIQTEQARLLRLEARLRQIEQEGIMPKYDILLKQVNPLSVASIREIIPLGVELGRSHEKILAYLEQHHIPYLSPRILLLHSRYTWYDDSMGIDVEAAIPLAATSIENEQVNIRTLPGGVMACTIHMGSNMMLGQVHAALHSWLEENEYQIVGVPRQLYLQQATGDSLSYVTEVQFPVPKQ